MMNTDSIWTKQMCDNTIAYRVHDRKNITVSVFGSYRMRILLEKSDTIL